jgi:hypothetical protein
MTDQLSTDETMALLDQFEADDLALRNTLANALEDVHQFLARFVVVSDAARSTMALWIAHTMILDVADSTPYLAFVSAEMRSGKTRALELLELLANRAVLASSMSSAALFRYVNETQPTVLLDEVDAIFGTRPTPDSEGLRAILNSGHRRGSTAIRMGGPKMTTVMTFETFSPKAFAGIGNLPTTIADRSIIITMRRRTPAEKVEPFRRRQVEPQAAHLKEQLEEAATAASNLVARILQTVRPSAALNDRAADSWEILIAIAEVAGNDWPARAATAAMVLSGDGNEDPSTGTQLLADIRDIFAATGAKQLASSSLLEELHSLESSPWGDWYGKPITAQFLAKQLRPYGIAPATIRIESSTPKGYRVEQFSDPFARYLPRSRNTATNAASIDETPVLTRNNPPQMLRVETPETPIDTGNVAVLRVNDAEGCDGCFAPAGFDHNPGCPIEVKK